MKPLSRKSYGHIPHLPGSKQGPGDHQCDPGLARIATERTRDCRDSVIVSEKVDGSNVAVAKINSEIVPLIRAGYHARQSHYIQHHYFADWVNLNQDRFDALLHEKERVCGEWLLQAHGTIYHLQHEPFVVFDIMYDDSRVLFQELRERTNRCGFIMPRIIHIGNAFSVDEALKAIEISGHGAFDPVEGAVWKVERNHPRKGMVVDFLVKYVRPEAQPGRYLPQHDCYENAVWNIRPEELYKCSQ